MENLRYLSTLPITFSSEKFTQLNILSTIMAAIINFIILFWYEKNVVGT